MGACRGKFKVKIVEHHHAGYEKITLKPEYNPNDDKDRLFHDATPTAELTMHITNAHLVGTFKPGEFYYVDLTPISDAEASQS